jgi:hypothetical protein
MGTIVTSEITPRVFVADWFVAQNWDALDALGVTHVVSVCEIPPIVSSKIAHMHVCIVDLPIADISDHFEKTTKFIRDALAKEGTKVLVCLLIEGCVFNTRGLILLRSLGPLSRRPESQHLRRLCLPNCRKGPHRR